jgi:hypothetical protein
MVRSAANLPAFRSWPSPATRLKLAASALIAVPAALLLALAIGEMAGGEASGIQHVPEAAALLLLLVAAWRYPHVTGLLLVAIGVIVFTLWLVLIVTSADIDWHSIEILGWIGAGLMVFALPVVGGLLLIKAARLDRPV